MLLHNLAKQVEGIRSGASWNRGVDSRKGCRIPALRRQCAAKRRAIRFF